jgi:hypothetical protein
VSAVPLTRQGIDPAEKTIGREARSPTSSENPLSKADVPVLMVTLPRYPCS